MEHDEAEGILVRLSEEGGLEAFRGHWQRGLRRHPTGNRQCLPREIEENKGKFTVAHEDGKQDGPVLANRNQRHCDQEHEVLIAET